MRNPKPSGGDKGVVARRLRCVLGGETGDGLREEGVTIIRPVLFTGKRGEINDLVLVDGPIILSLGDRIVCEVEAARATRYFGGLRRPAARRDHAAIINVSHECAIRAVAGLILD